MFEHVYLLHGKGGSTEGSVKLMEDILAPMLASDQQPPRFHRFSLKHSDPSVLAEDSYADLCKDSSAISHGSLLVGISLGGLIAAKLAQDLRPDLKVVALSSPTSLDGLSLEPKENNNLYALYSSSDEVIEDLADWEPYTPFDFDVHWMKNHNIDHQIYMVCFVLFHFVHTLDFSEAMKRAHFEETMDIARTVMRRYRGALRELAGR